MHRRESNPFDERKLGAGHVQQSVAQHIPERHQHAVRCVDLSDSPNDIFENNLGHYFADFLDLTHRITATMKTTTTTEMTGINLGVPTVELYATMIAVHTKSQYAPCRSFSVQCFSPSFAVFMTSLLSLIESTLARAISSAEASLHLRSRRFCV